MCQLASRGFSCEMTAGRLPINANAHADQPVPIGFADLGLPNGIQQRSVDAA